MDDTLKFRVLVPASMEASLRKSLPTIRDSDEVKVLDVKPFETQGAAYDLDLAGAGEWLWMGVLVAGPHVVAFAVDVIKNVAATLVSKRLERRMEPLQVVIELSNGRSVTLRADTAEGLADIAKHFKKLLR